VSGSTIKFWARLVAFTVIALYIVLGPLIGRSHDFSEERIRRWTMFGAIGVGVLKGEFSVTFPDGSRAVFTPFEMLGIERYPPILSIRFPHLVMNERDLRSFVRAFCERKPVQLSFSGWTGTREGWRSLAATDLCTTARLAP
jgi:hypothetical protein